MNRERIARELLRLAEELDPERRRSAKPSRQAKNEFAKKYKETRKKIQLVARQVAELSKDLDTYFREALEAADDYDDTDDDLSYRQDHIDDFLEVAEGIQEALDMHL